MIQAPDAVERMICRWAEAKYRLVGVQRVEWVADNDADWSDWTPGNGPFLRVDVWANGKKKEFQEEGFNADLLRDILRFREAEE